MNEVVDCEIVDGVEIDQAELASMEDMMREASSTEPSSNPLPPSTLLSSRSTVSNLTDAQPIGRASHAVMLGDENDLLSESPVFQKAKNLGAERSAADAFGSTRMSLDLKEVEEPLDEGLVNEINDYLTGIMED